MRQPFGAKRVSQYCPDTLYGTRRVATVLAASRASPAECLSQSDGRLSQTVHTPTGQFDSARATLVAP